MSFFQTITNLINKTLQFGVGGNILNVTSTPKFTAAGGTTIGLEIPIRGTTAANAVALTDLKERVLFVTKGVDGATTGTHASEYVIVSKAGGGKNAGAIIYDAGGTAVEITSYAGLTIVTASAYSEASGSTLGLVAGSTYIASAAETWQTAGATAASQHSIKISFAYDSAAGIVESIHSIPNGAQIEHSEIVITEVFNGTTPSLALSVNGSSPVALLSLTSAEVAALNQYESSAVALIGATGTGPVKMAVTQTNSTTGAGYAIVYFSTPMA